MPEPRTCSPPAESPPVVVADEPDPAQPDDWRIHAYFDAEPTDDELAALRDARRPANPEIEHLEDATDWVTMSQPGCEPIRAGRFFVHTPTHSPTGRRARSLRNRRRARLRHRPARDHRRLPRRARPAAVRRQRISPTSPTSAPAPACSPSPRWRCGRAAQVHRDRHRPDRDRRVARECARSTQVKLGHGAGELLLAVADGMDHAACSSPARRSTCSSPTSLPAR